MANVEKIVKKQQLFVYIFGQWNNMLSQRLSPVCDDIFFADQCSRK